jgi:hypothetical protein
VTKRGRRTTVDDNGGSLLSVVAERAAGAGKPTMISMRESIPATARETTA